MGAKSKQKGSQFERDICKALSLWITNGKHEDVFWRSAMSGGRYTVAKKRNKKYASSVGDISAVKKEGNSFINAFAIECKFYRNLNLGGMFQDKAHGLNEFWKEIRERARETHKLPMLIAKQNNLETFVVLTAKGMKRMGVDTPKNNCDAFFASHSAYFMLFADFIEFLEWHDE